MGFRSKVKYPLGKRSQETQASVGAIKRFTQDGTFAETVAVSQIVPGCKHTPIGMSVDGNKVYMLDITKRNILVMARETPP